MLLRQIYRPAVTLRIGALRSFTFTRTLRDDVTEGDKLNHYEVLKVARDATPAQIKKSFYTLSKAHHPDANPRDPHASKRFVRISEAYSILSTPAKRAAYDRSLPALHPHHGHHQHHHHHRGSYHSTGPAGGRPASGLSQRRPRTTNYRASFRGPPPSFYAQGGWGTHGESRKAAHEESTGGWGSGRANVGGADGAAGEPGTGYAGSGKEGGMGPGQDPYGHRGDVPHFDRVSHERTHRREDERRARRMASRPREESVGEGFSSPVFFIIISAVLASAVSIPLMIGTPNEPRQRQRRQVSEQGSKS